MTREESQWLIKSSGRILGPFPSAKIAELLRTREVSVLDEVSQPLRRWQTIQYHDEFKEIVESLRKASLSERTEASWTPGTSNLTQTLTDLSDAELTDEISGSGLTGFTATAKEIVIHNVEESQRIQQPAHAGRFQTSQGQNTAIQRQVEKTTRGLWILTGVVLLAVAAFILNKRMSQVEPRPSAGNLRQSVVANVQVGKYAEALKDLKRGVANEAQAGDLAIYYGSLLIQVEGETAVARRMLNQVLAGRKPETKQAYTGLGIADLIDGNLDGARENFERALSYDSGYVPALVNLSAMHIRRADYSRAKAMAMKALQISPFQGEAMLSLAEAQLYLFRKDGNSNELQRVNKMLKDFSRKGWDYAGEIGFYSLYFDFLARDKNVETSLQNYLDRDPELTADHRHNVFIYKGSAQWKVLARFCEQMSDKLGDSPRVATLLAACYANETRWDNARREIDKAVHQSPKDPLIQAWYSQILKESGDADQASVVLGRATELNRRGEFVLPVLLQARFCQENGDVMCARDSWQRIYEHDMEYLPALAGLAWVNSQNKSYTEALKLIDKGLRISPDYSPLLILRQRAEREGWYAGS
jgi:Tfp pilus assembly protein PilF